MGLKPEDDLLKFNKQNEVKTWFSFTVAFFAWNLKWRTKVHFMTSCLKLHILTVKDWLLMWRLQTHNFLALCIYYTPFWRHQVLVFCTVFKYVLLTLALYLWVHFCCESIVVTYFSILKDNLTNTYGMTQRWDKIILLQVTKKSKVFVLKPQGRNFECQVLHESQCALNQYNSIYEHSNNKLNLQK